jgi:hypothetical protein
MNDVASCRSVLRGSSGWSEEAFLGLLNQLAALVLGVACE